MTRSTQGEAVEEYTKLRIHLKRLMEDLAAGPAKKVKDILFKTDDMLTPEFAMVANHLDFRFRGKSLEDEERKVFKDVKLTLLPWVLGWI